MLPIEPLAAPHGPQCQPWTSLQGVCCSPCHRTAQRPDEEKRAERDRVPFGYPAGDRPITLLAEAGLYRFLMRSDKPVAREFQD